MLNHLMKSDMPFPIMKGYIRTDQKCKYCGASNWQEIKSGNLRFWKCPDHDFIVTRFWIDIQWQGIRVKTRNDRKGEPLKYYDKADHTLGRIREEIEAKAFDPANYKETNINEVQFSSAIHRWIQIKNLKPSTRFNYKYDIERILIPHFGDKDVREIRTKDIENFYYNKIKLDKAKGAERQHGIMRTLKAFFHSLYNSEIIERVPNFSNILKDVKLVEKQKGYIPWSDFMKVVDDMPPWIRGATITARMLGLRSGECAALKSKDFDWKNETVAICRAFSRGALIETVKEDNPQTLPLPPLLKQYMITNINPDAFVFNNTYGRPINVGYWSDLWLDAARKHGINQNLYTATRHSFCTDLRESDIDGEMQRILMRHKSIKSTQGYGQISMDVKRRNMEQFLSKICPEIKSSSIKV